MSAHRELKTSRGQSSAQQLNHDPEALPPLVDGVPNLHLSHHTARTRLNLRRENPSIGDLKLIAQAYQA